MEKHAENKKDTQPFSSASAKILGKVNKVQLLNVLIYSTVVKAHILAYIF